MSLVLKGGEDLRRVSRQLRGQDSAAVRAKFRKELRAAAAPMVPAVRASIAAIPVTGTKSTGLRGRMQRATRLKVRTTGREAQVAILVDPKKMPDGEKAIPQLMEGARKWRHPVYGDRASWVTQPPHPYFFKVVKRLGPISRVAIARVTAQITKEIT